MTLIFKGWRVPESEVHKMLELLEEGETESAYIREALRLYNKTRQIKNAEFQRRIAGFATQPSLAGARTKEKD